ncbi:hypothetical protein FHQ26_03885 [Testudinibacter sp. TR-2022]|uniref:DUF5718 family protein n=1 Tax=Testudinibacter sp. TR-2022 TaxID=2585029 RepID=UPI0011187C1A|nr:DUF5718 family protein [Testudinibacter sp. TR-2022]TNH03034.1 hypothetical protein FHQ22_09245 [Pasteurellaceae bacterium Phil31]TNH09745.1 hypothetical protein FHQ25_07365 [Testudinibacter sp. TR-2022]TNH11132.1 hypothetical protein FHQ26_03885 [Testudinibacter sp. TR-2022]TNH15002.1 hypothetical protein FIA56_03810 [Testudinibacter sp. TR-2022]TNH16919.1 hypothetical protein FHQ23_08110 [Testudinibacter sp. TR-2022]
MAFKQAIGFGVAGNFAGHLEQAGEAADFKQVEVQEAHQPKAIFPFYVPHFDGNFLSVYPLSADTLRFPQDADNLQIEPEVAIVCDIEYDQHKQVTALYPKLFGAYNDCSIRRPNAAKIADKKNWGEQTKGLSATLIPLDGFAPGCNLDQYRIACFHQRGEQFNIYGIDSSTVGYSYFHQKLLDWIVDRMNNQPDQGPMHPIASLLEKANYPQQAVISIGATRYTDFGETHFLQPGDVSMVVVYNATKHSADEIIVMAKQQQFEGDLSALVQKVI